MPRPTPADRQATHDYVAECIAEGAAMAGHLRAALEDEQRAMEQRDQTLLDDAVARKCQYIAELQHADPRQRIVARLTSPDGGEQRPFGAATLASLLPMLQRLDPTGTLPDAWRSLIDITTHCRRLNERNGLLAIRLRSRTEQALLLLQAAAGIETPTTVYGPDGAVPTPLTRLPGPR